ncbi:MULTISPECIES: UxaA family hydrolase [Variovorax]|uniref:UxaA family hydrolase n=1 Tax=Variovorax TaxID=34072 RepID=UPI000A3F2EBE|nr:MULTISPECIES: UxaA family hydrolase [Variovorax]MBN8758709.1 UxaA family hydrolase [Variovorax sp.]UKI07676.1 UxaA family hydrolase [Variovorax paradoxus]
MNTPSPGESRLAPNVPRASRHANDVPQQAHLEFQGYVRPDGRVGTRNHIGIFVVGNCGATTARMVADHFTSKRLASYGNVDGVVPFVHELGCGMEMTGEPMNLLRRTIAGTIRNPNIVGAVVIALGCERNNIRGFFEQEKLVAGPMLHMIVMQEIGGTANAVAAGIAAVEEMLPMADACQREPVPARHLVVGLQSAAVDDLAARSANPVLGAAVDLLVEAGGTAILSETSDLAALQEQVARRAASAQVGGRIAQRIHWWKTYTHGRDTQLTRTSGSNPGGMASSADNAISGFLRAGSSPIQAVLEYAHPVNANGLVLMDAPAYAAVSATGQVASGANLVALTTGLGSTFGAAGVPTVKLVSNSAAFARMEDDSDIDCGPVLDGSTGVLEMAQVVLQRWLEYASGELTKSEELGVGDNEYVPWPIGVLA